MLNIVYILFKFASDIHFPKTDYEKNLFSACMEDLNKMVGLDDLKKQTG